MNRRLTDHHRALIADDRGPLGRRVQRLLLRAASIPYGWAVAARNRLYDRGRLPIHKAGVPVVSVGNLTVGGTGKTPCVEFLARRLIAQGVRLAVLSRGYGRPPGSDFSQLNDEAMVLRDNVPEIVQYQGADRVALARRAAGEGRCRLLLLDDGFQHRRLARDLDIVLLDATDPWGRGRLLPRGLLREPPENLARADAVVLTRCDQVAVGERRQLSETVSRIAPSAVVAESSHRPVELVNSDGDAASVATCQGPPVAAFCGLGNPRAFRDTLTGLGAKLVAFRAYADHHDYTATDLRELQQWVRMQPPGTLVLTTQKDLVKLRRTMLGGRELWAVRIRLEVLSGLDDLERLLRPLAARAAGQEARAA